MLLVIIIKLLIFTGLCHSVKYYFYLQVEHYVLTLLTKWNLISQETVYYVGHIIQIRIPLILGTESLSKVLLNFTEEQHNTWHYRNTKGETYYL